MRSGRQASFIRRRTGKTRGLAGGRTEDGFRAGHADGWSDGYHYGRCRKVMEQVPDPSEILYDLHVVFVHEALFALNEGIRSGLESLVSRVSVVNPMQADAAAYIAGLTPDLVLVLNGIHAFPPEQAQALKQYGVKTAVWFADDPYFTDVSSQIAPLYDYVFTHEMGCVPFYQGLGCPNVHYLPLAASRKVFYPQPVGSEYRTDICFIGTGFWNRIAFFDQISRYLTGKKVMISGGLWTRLKAYPRLKHRITLAGTPFEQTAAYYSGAKIVVNLHRAAEDSQHNKNSRRLPALSVNPRTFEMAACGTLQLTDIRQDLNEFYIPGSEIETYTSAQEWIEKVEYYLNHEDRRREVALRGLHRTMKEHTYRHRLIQLLTTVFGDRLESANKRSEVTS